MDRKELFARVDVWSMNRGFRGDLVNDWEDIFQPLLDKGFSFDEAAEIIENVLSVAQAERGE